MCGRYMIVSNTEALRRLFRFPELPNLEPRYNVAPSQDVPVIRLGGDGRAHFAMLRWGLVPSWAKDLKIGTKMINARAETVAEKPAFRAAFKRRRCLIPADGFYEWRAEEGGLPARSRSSASAKAGKQPYLIRMADHAPFAFAGLWESWKNPESGETVESCTIIVTDANELVAEIHDRMPVILMPNDHDPWLFGDPERADLTALLGPYPAKLMTASPVSKAVGNVKNDDPSLIEPPGGGAEPLLL